jgi:hypothetical protein
MGRFGCTPWTHRFVPRQRNRAHNLVSSRPTGTANPSLQKAGNPAQNCNEFFGSKQQGWQDRKDHIRKGQEAL